MTAAILQGCKRRESAALSRGNDRNVKWNGCAGQASLADRTYAADCASAILRERNTGKGEHVRSGAGINPDMDFSDLRSPNLGSDADHRGPVRSDSRGPATAPRQRLHSRPWPVARRCLHPPLRDDPRSRCRCRERPMAWRPLSRRRQQKGAGSGHTAATRLPRFLPQASQSRFTKLIKAG